MHYSPKDGLEYITDNRNAGDLIKSKNEENYCLFVKFIKEFQRFNF